MAEQPHSLRSLFRRAEEERKQLEASPDITSASLQENLQRVISEYEECLGIVDRVALFSRNETLEDVASADIELDNSPAPLPYLTH